MVPSAFVALTELPLTPSGKVDRRQLAGRPLPPDADAAYRAVLDGQQGGRQRHTSGEADETGGPAPIHRVVAEVWADALCRDAVDIDADLFAAGANSRAALEVAAQLSEIFQVDLPARLMSDFPTVADQAAYLAEVDRSSSHSIAAEEAPR